jgi:pimeloyl-ACP methyl ester carboxylesterase
MGISFGGYFATRIAAHEPRIRALIANSPIVDLHAYMASFIGFDPAAMPESEDVRLRDFRVGDEDLKRIACPVLGLAGSGEGREPLAQLDRFRRSVSGVAATHVFTEEEGADGHCQSGNLAYSAAVSMDWLDEVFA